MHVRHSTVPQGLSNRGVGAVSLQEAQKMAHPNGTADAARTAATIKTANNTSNSYKRVKGRSHTVETRKAIHPQKPHATSQSSRIQLFPRQPASNTAIGSPSQRRHTTELTITATRRLYVPHSPQSMTTRPQQHSRQAAHAHVITSNTQPPPHSLHVSYCKCAACMYK